MNRAITISMLREQRRYRRILRAIYSGEWRRVLLGLQQSQHRFPETKDFAGRIANLMVKFNLVALAVDWHATVLAQLPAVTVVPDGFEAQQDAIAKIRARSLFDALLMEATTVLNVEGYAVISPEATERGVALCLHDNDRMYPWVGYGTDGQPIEWRQRWIIERPDASDARKSRSYLREVRYAAGVIENRAYVTESTDVLADDKQLKPVTLIEALGAELAAMTPERIETGLDSPTPVMLTSDRSGGVPRPIIGEHDLDLIDASAAALSRISRTLEQHGHPKFRVPESAIDPKTAKADLSADAFVDPDKQMEPIRVEMEFDAMLEFCDRTIELLMTALKLSKSLAGIKPGGGNSAISAESMRLESKGTLAHGRKTAVYCQPALSRLFTSACWIESRMPISAGSVRGFPVAPVTATLRPDIPRDREDIAVEQQTLLASGLTSRWRAVAAIHGEDQADAVIAEIEADEDRKSKLAQQSLMTDFGFTGKPEVGAPAVGAAVGAEGDDV